MLEVCKIIVGLFLIVLSVLDIKDREFPVLLLLLLFAFLIGGQCIQPFRAWSDCLMGVLPGALLVLFHYLTRGGIGLGDGLLIGILGLFLGFWENLSLLFFSLLLEAVFAGGLCVKRKLAGKAFERNLTLPFVPFITCGYVLLLFF